MAKQKMLVAGASGLVGFAAVKHFHSLPDWDVVGVSRRIPTGLNGTTLISVDLTDKARCAEIFSKMSDVTHVVYAALYEKPGLVKGWRERDQMETNRSMLQNLFEPLQVVAKNLQHVTLLQGTKAYGAHIEPFPVPARERWPRHQHENFYWLQEDYLREQQKSKSWHWTVLRPQIIFGESLGSNMNAIPAIGVYAALLKERGLPLSFPGGAPALAEAVDADLLARMCEWTATSPACRNEIFNATNGDVFIWQNVWPAIAEAFGMEVGPATPMSLAEEMPKRDAEWAAIVKKYNLRAPARVRDYVGQSFIFTDLIFAYGAEKLVPTMLVSTIKARQAGFHDCMDTEDMFRKWFRHFQEHRLLPPSGKN